MNTYEQNKEQLIAYFQNGCKPKNSRRIGFELEHFVISQETGESISYYGNHGVEELLTLIKGKFPHLYIPEGRLIGVYNKDYSITLEPAAQLEISINPQETIEDAMAIYKDFRSLVDPILLSWGQKLEVKGYQPLSKVDELDMIPKSRYIYMDRYFQTSGSRGRNMMRGTASTQISVDYHCEEDFVRKFRMAYRLMPLLKLLTDNTSVFEGKASKGYLVRSDIWNNTDKERTGIIPGLFEDDFGFERYAEFLMNMPLIFIQEGDQYVYTDKSTSAQLWKDKIFTEEDIDFILSMNFQDVRLKHYIEIRYADSLPEEYMAAYGMLIKGIFYKREVLAELESLLDQETEAIKKAEKELALKGYQAEVYGRNAGKILDDILRVTEAAMTEKEKIILAPLAELIKKRENLTDRSR